MELCLQLAKALKDLPLRIQTASLKERREVITGVVHVLSNPGKPTYFTDDDYLEAKINNILCEKRFEEYKNI